MDTGIQEQEGKISFTTMIRDNFRQFCGGLTSFKERILSPQLAKAIVLRETLSWLKDLRDSNVDIEVDVIW